MRSDENPQSMRDNGPVPLFAPLARSVSSLLVASGARLLRFTPTAPAEYVRYRAHALHGQLVPISLLIVAAASLTGGIEWSELAFTRTMPGENDLVGTWTPTSETIRVMEQSGGYRLSEHELTLSSDGTFSMLNMPDWWSDPYGKSHGRFESGRGTWRIEEDGTFRTIYVVSLAFPNESRRVHLRQQTPPYLIHIPLGDPSSHYYMLFEKHDHPRAHSARLGLPHALAAPLDRPWSRSLMPTELPSPRLPRQTEH